MLLHFLKAGNTHLNSNLQSYNGNSNILLLTDY